MSDPLSPESKTCNICKMQKSIDNFNKSKKTKDGLGYTCKSCKNEQYKTLKRRIKPDMKQINCKCCGTLKDLSNFRRNAVSLTGYRDECKACYRTRITTQSHTQRDSKICQKCDILKSTEEYNKDASRTDGYMYICKDCLAKATKKRSVSVKILPIEITCKHCGLCKPFSAFRQKRNSAQGYVAVCKGCIKKYTKENECMRNHLKKRKHLKLDLKGNKKCTDCGSVFPPEALDFDHTDRKRKYKTKYGKRQSPGHIGSLKQFSEEAKKCEIRCGYCHALKTKKERGNVPIARFKSWTIRNFINNEKLARDHCIDCDRKVTPENFQAFDFDHKPAEKKWKSVSVMCNVRWEEAPLVFFEMDKCELRCRNCHRIITEKRRREKQTHKEMKQITIDIIKKALDVIKV